MFCLDKQLQSYVYILDKRDVLFSTCQRLERFPLLKNYYFCFFHAFLYWFLMIISQIKQLFKIACHGSLWRKKNEFIIQMERYTSRQKHLLIYEQSYFVPYLHCKNKQWINFMLFISQNELVIKTFWFNTRLLIFF